LQQYDCTEQQAVAQPAQPPDAGGGAVANAGAHPQPHAGSQDNGNGKLLLLQLTEHLTKNWSPFKALCQYYACTRFEEQLQLHLPQKHKATVADSTLRVEMNTLEEQTDNTKTRDLYWKPLSWLGTIRPTSANDAFDPALWETSPRH
jgi:hypothetical protein